MGDNKSLDKYILIAALISDVYHNIYGSSINTKYLRLTLQKVKRRYIAEGTGFLTKSLPRLGKSLDKALAEDTPMNCKGLGFKPHSNTQVPKLFGDLFLRVLQPNGAVLSDPCIDTVTALRDVLYCFYKYELPYSEEQEQHVIDRFTRTEQELEHISARLRQLGDSLVEYTTTRSLLFGFENNQAKEENRQKEVARRARARLSALLRLFDPKDITPKHGPGAVSTKEQLWDKYRFNNVSAKITRVFPLDEYFYASLGHVCDQVDRLQATTDYDLPARVCLVPKDSRGPRLISCEPVDYQWVQQGLRQALCRWIEHHPLTRDTVFFTDQVPNQIGALLGSETGRYATLDLNEASDRVSLELVRLLFPPHIYEFLESTRSSSTVLPDGLVLPLWKFAPMGSSLCFPIMALTIWAILDAAAPDSYTRERIHVYGDDVIVPTAYAADAIEQLESFGLKVNRDKSCIRGFFRESCGMDAYKGTNVTPIKLKTVWSSTPSPNAYPAWIAYANAYWDKGYRRVYEYIVEELHSVYGAIPSKDMNLSCPSLAWVPTERLPKKCRTNPKGLQRREWLVWDIKAPRLIREIDGWSMLLRHFVESADQPEVSPSGMQSSVDNIGCHEPFRVRSYTRRNTSMLVKRWR